ncbi:MAG: MopE-related protein [Myxococcota bacterium]
MIMRVQEKYRWIPLLFLAACFHLSAMSGCSDEPVPATETPSAPPEGTPTPGDDTPTPGADTPTPEDDTPTPPSDDPDGDGVSASDGDCQPNNGEIYPGASELPYDGIDQDCDGADLLDVDGDGALGLPAGGDDCDDTDSDRFPGHDETPYDGVDQDCDGTDLTDIDEDGFPGALENPVDCNDEDPDVNPGETELPYDGIDQDCSGADLNDQDGDGYVGTQGGGDDCDDLDANTFPGNPEFEDDKDNDCDGQIDEALDTTDDDADGASEQQGDCNDADPNINPSATEIPYDGIDQDCSGADLNDVDQDGFVASQAGGSDCNDNEPLINPGVTEVPYDGIDQDCSGADLVDVDGDTYIGATAGGDDCNDTTPLVNPGAAEVPYDGIDQDCSGADLIDVDNDGVSGTQAGGGDCNDNNPNINPNVSEVCDGIDNNCSGAADENATDASTYYADADGDSYGSSTSTTQSCTQPTGFVSRAGDCNDSAAAINPAASEVCDAVDNNCNGQLDEGVKNTYYQDLDGDKFGNPNVSTQACTAPAGYVTNNTDCNDTSAAANPSATETCDLIDNDCDSQVDEGVKTTFYQDSDGDTYGNPSATTQACTAPSGYVTNNTDCNDTSAAANPTASETCDLIDNDCDTQVDEGVQNTYYQDLDGDKFGNPNASTQACTAPAGYVTNNTDCADNSVTVYPGATEFCNNIDDDCDGTADENAGTVWYRDADGDTFGDGKSTLTACTKPSGYVSNDLDCNDSNANIKPGATETCNGLDDDCDTQLDEGVTTTFYKDGDGDGYGVSTTTLQACSKPSGYATVAGDCDDTKSSVSPGATEICDGIDNDCDSKIDGADGLTCSLKALIYYDSGATFADDAVALFSGSTSTLTTTGSAFNTAYDAGGFNVIVIDAPGTSLDSGLVTRLTSWIAAGKPLIFSWWDLDTNPTLQTTLGVKTTAERSTFAAIYPTSGASINLWTLSQSVPVPLNGSDQAGDNGDTLTTLETDGRILGSFGSSTSGQGAIALTKNGKVIVNGFLPWDTQTVDNDGDGRADMTEMYFNQLRLLGF